MDCLHFFYASQATYAMYENGLYFDRVAFFIFRGIFFFLVGTSKTKQNRKLKLQILGVTLSLLKIRTLNETTWFFQNHCIIRPSFLTTKNYLLVSKTSKVMMFFPYPLKNVFANSIFADISVSKQTVIFFKSGTSTWMMVVISVIY